MSYADVDDPLTGGYEAARCLLREALVVFAWGRNLMMCASLCLTSWDDEEAKNKYEQDGSKNKAMKQQPERRQDSTEYRENRCLKRMAGQGKKQEK